MSNTIEKKSEPVKLMLIILVTSVLFFIGFLSTYLFENNQSLIRLIFLSIGIVNTLMVLIISIIKQFESNQKNVLLPMAGAIILLSLLVLGAIEFYNLIELKLPHLAVFLFRIYTQ